MKEEQNKEQNQINFINHTQPTSPNRSKLLTPLTSIVGNFEPDRPKITRRVSNNIGKIN